MKDTSGIGDGTWDWVTAAHQAVCEHLERHGIAYTTDGRQEPIQFRVNTGNAVQNCICHLSGTGQVLTFLVVYPVVVPEERRVSVAELLIRANYGQVLGSFELDMAEGEVRYHFSQIFDGETPTESMLQSIFGVGFETADRYFPALMQHLHGGLTAEDAVYLVDLDAKLELEPAPKLPGKAKGRGKGAKRKAPKGPKPGGSEPPESLPG